MQLSSLLLTGIAALATQASAFSGQMAASGYETSSALVYQYIYLTDYNTGSTYKGQLWGGFDGCVADKCNIYFQETSAGGYNFYSQIWKTSDGCHNIDFEGALDAHHGYCCGSLPCDFTA